MVVFLSQGYAKSTFCQIEWKAIEKRLRSRRQRKTVLLFAFDEHRPSESELPNGYNIVALSPGSKDSQDHATEIILRRAGVNRWIVDKRLAISRLEALRGGRPHRLFEHRLQLHGGTTLESSLNDPWRADPVAQLCRGRLVKFDSGESLPANIVCLRGQHGSGKSILLLRSIASAGDLDGLPVQSWLLDFTNNQDVCDDPDSFARVPANELAKFLRAQVRPSAHNQHVLLAIDGLDTAARHLSVVNDQKTAPDLVIECLTSLCDKMRELHRERNGKVTFTIVISTNALAALPGAEPDDQNWRRTFKALSDAQTLFADLLELGDVDRDSYERIYRHHLNLKENLSDAAANYVADRKFLKLPLFLDCAAVLGAGQLRDCRTRSDFLRESKNTRKVVWPNELDRLSTELLEFISAHTTSVLHNERLKMMLRREWTAAWLELLTEAMQSSEHVLGFVKDLKSKLLDDETHRWDLSATFALGNVITALSEAGHAPTFSSSLRFCNLRRATLDRAVFERNSRFEAVDCSGARFRDVKLAEGCLFIATDLTTSEWDIPPRHGERFVECLGIKKEGSQ